MINREIQALLINRYFAWPKATQRVMATFLCLLFVGIGYAFILSSPVGRYYQLKTEEVVLKRDFEMKQQEASTMDAYRGQMATIDKRFQQLLQQLPTKNEMPRVLDDLSKKARSSGLTVELFAPKSELYHDFYIELPIQMKVRGSYQQLLMFLSRMAQMDRIVSWHDVLIERPLGEEKPDQPSTSLQMQLIAKIYRYYKK